MPHLVLAMLLLLALFLSQTQLSTCDFFFAENTRTFDLTSQRPGQRTRTYREYGTL
ncbi:hypothetical protein GYH30_040202 [Glycine max]|nr:hypothetical protein GYH30_040202 [Glycine max]